MSRSFLAVLLVAQVLVPGQASIAGDLPDLEQSAERGWLRHRVPARDLALIQMSERVDSTEPERLPKLPSLSQSQSSLKAQLENNRHREHATLLHMAAAEEAAIARRSQRAKLRKARQRLQAQAAKLRRKLEAARGHTARLERSAGRARRDSATRVRKARVRELQRQRAAAMAIKLTKQYSQAQERLSDSTQKAVELDARAQRKAKFEVKAADDEAAGILKRAQRKATVLKQKARQAAQRELVRAKDQETELRDDARSELAVAKRKLRRVNKLIKVTNGLSRKAKNQAFKSISQTEQLERRVEQAKAQVAAVQKQEELYEDKLQAY